MPRPLVNLFFREHADKLVDAGYTPEQVTQLRATIGDGTIIKLILDNLPSILQAVLAIIALFGQKVPPTPKVDG